MGKRRIQARSPTQSEKDLLSSQKCKNIHQSLNLSKLVVQTSALHCTPKLEEALYKWICYHKNAGKQINGLLTVHYAEKLEAEAKKHRAVDQQRTLNFSDGWMSRFKSWYGFSFKKVHGESMSADGSTISAQLPPILEEIKSYHPNDVWNADEFGLFLRQPLGWTL